MRHSDFGLRSWFTAAAILAASACAHAPTPAPAPSAPATPAAPAAPTAPTAPVVRESDRWDLTALYPSAEAWQADLEKAESQLKHFAGCKGRYARSAADYKRCADLVLDVNKRLSRLQTYAGLLQDEDTRIAANLERSQRVQVAAVKYAEAASFIAPETIRAGQKRFEKFLKLDPSLGIYRHGLDDLFRQQQHVLDDAGESLLAVLSLPADTAGTTYQILTSADIPWPRLSLGGQEVLLNQAAYTKYRASLDRDERKRVYDAFWGKWKDYERTLGVTLYGQVKNDVAFSRARKHATARGASLFANAIPVAVYDTLIAQTNAALPTLHRYLKLRARMLGLSDLRYYDIYPPLVKSDLSYSIDQATQLTLEAAKPLGDEYVAAMEKGFKERWMDVYPREGKQSGAYMNPGAYDVHPYVLMNYNGDWESVSTLAHEWGHAMHSYLATQAQPYTDANYSIFTAEIASQVNEELLLERVLASATSREEKLYYLGSALEKQRLSFFRQAMFAEFERDIHAAVESGDTLTGESLTRRYCELLKRHHGDAKGVLKVDDAYCLEWAYIPHFYGNFYVYQYATSIAAASAYAKRILDNTPGAREQYLDLLKAGGSDYPYELLKRSGIDLATAAPYQALMARMNEVMDQIEALLDKN